MTALMEERPSISVELHPAEKIKTRKANAEAKIDVIPNRAICPVRACPELAEGNLFFYHPSKPLPLRREIKTRKQELGENEGRCCWH
jgi:hypothetical protein